MTSECWSVDVIRPNDFRLRRSWQFINQLVNLFYNNLKEFRIHLPLQLPLCLRSHCVYSFIGLCVNLSVYLFACRSVCLRLLHLELRAVSVTCLSQSSVSIWEFISVLHFVCFYPFLSAFLSVSVCVCPFLSTILPVSVTSWSVSVCRSVCS